MKSAMTEGLAGADDNPAERHVTLFHRWSAGGSGTLVSGNVMIDRRYLERPGNVVLESDVAMERLAEWASAGTHAGNHLWMQLSHPGRQCTRVVASEPVAPSTVQLELGGLFARPRALGGDEIEAIVHAFAAAAALAKRAGFTGVQVHGAHGYLCSQFLSMLTNQRTDEWGGGLENRARFLRAVVRVIRDRFGGDFPVAVKLNSSDFQKGGFTHEEACQVAAWLADDGIDLLEISGGTYENPRLLGTFGAHRRAEGTERREAYFLEYARDIRRYARVPLAVTGGFRSLEIMERAIENGDLDVVGLARPHCTEPDIARRLLAGDATTARTDERGVSLGGGWLGPGSDIAMLRGLNAQANTAWYYQQIIHLSEGRDPELGLSARGALARHFRRELALSRARKRR
jgi:2,4-dienoyl-CoA reductase-like NADH-dependent reductase (Old Yellow Enzyme family)